MGSVSPLTDTLAIMKREMLSSLGGNSHSREFRVVSFVSRSLEVSRRACMRQGKGRKFSIAKKLSDSTLWKTSSRGDFFSVSQLSSSHN